MKTQSLVRLASGFLLALTLSGTAAAKDKLTTEGKFTIKSSTVYIGESPSHPHHFHEVRKGEKSFGKFESDSQDEGIAATVAILKAAANANLSITAREHELEIMQDGATVTTIKLSRYPGSQKESVSKSEVVKIMQAAVNARAEAERTGQNQTVSQTRNTAVQDKAGMKPEDAKNGTSGGPLVVSPNTMGSAK